MTRSPRRPLSLAVAQPRCHPYDVEANAIEHARTVAAAGARVVVFPELSLTGYYLDAPAVSPDDPRLEPLITACRAAGSVALAGAPVLGPAVEAGTTGSVAGSGSGAPQAPRSIGVLAVDGDRAVVAYRKLYLGQLEAAHFTPGTEPALIVVDGWRLGLAVCKDTGIPEHASATAALGVDVYVAGVLEHDHEADVQPARARRIGADHGLWVAVASFAGSTGEGYDRAAGGSTVFAPDGTAIAMADAEPGSWVTATLTSPEGVD